MRGYSSTRCLRSTVVPWPLLSVTTAFTSTATPTNAVSQKGDGSRSGSQRTPPPTTMSSAWLYMRGGTTHTNTHTSTSTSMRTSLTAATTAARLPSAIFVAPHVCAMRCTSHDSKTSEDNAEGHTTTTTTTATAIPASDPMAPAASPRFTRHADAERVAHQQEDNVQHRDFGQHDSGGGCCSHHVEDAVTTPPSGKKDFSTVFHQEVAAWRASHHHTHTDQHKGSAAQKSTPTAASGPGNEGSHPRSALHVRPEDVPDGVSHEAFVAHLKAEEEMQRFLAQNTMHSIRRSMSRDNAAAAAEAVLATSSTMRTRLAPHHGYRGVQALLDYNKQWAAEVSRFNPRYFLELAKEQKPEYLWIGCSDSRVPANEVIGLHPGDVFVHRNIGNLFSLSDLNCLSALQFAVDCLKVQHVIVAGHYKCGGVTAAMRGDHLGLTDHWIMQVADIKNKYWDRVLSDITEEYHLNVLCELNVLEQLSHVVNCRIVQRRWKSQNANDRYYGRTTSSVYVRPQYASEHLSETRVRSSLPTSVAGYEEELEVHGWVYSLDDGMLRPLLSLTRHSNVKKEITAAIEALFIRYSQMT